MAKQDGGGSGAGDAPRRARAPFQELVMVCAKCARKLGRGSGGKSKLRGELKKALKRGDHSVGKVRVVDVGCLALCPRRRQALATIASLGERRLVVLPGDVRGEAAAAALFPSRGLAARVPAPTVGPVLALVKAALQEPASDA